LSASSWTSSSTTGQSRWLACC